MKTRLDTETKETRKWPIGKSALKYEEGLVVT